MKIREAADFGHVARERRRKLGLTQAELADRVGVTRQWVVRFEAGNSDVSLSKTFSVLRELDLIVRTSAIGEEQANSTPSLKFKIPTIDVPRIDVTKLRGIAAISAMDTQVLMSELRRKIRQLDAQDREVSRQLRD